MRVDPRRPQSRAKALGKLALRAVGMDQPFERADDGGAQAVGRLRVHVHDRGRHRAQARNVEDGAIRFLLEHRLEVVGLFLRAH